jgi:carbamate kinase
VRVVIALGGNALARRGEAPDLASQRACVARAADAIAALAAEHDVVVTHGNGPQVGLLALQAEAAGLGEAPLDALGAESEGLLGYLIEQELGNRLPGRDVAALLTQVEVRADDPAFGSPSKPIGPVLPEAAARRLAAERGWVFGPEGSGLRRLVPSPAPQHLVELRTIQLLVRLGVLVVCAGGGGIPVVRRADGSHRGVEAVVDKDASAALLATGLGAERLLLLTDVPAVFSDWPAARRPIASASPRALAGLRFEAGSMGPKVDAACRFVKQTGGTAAIGALADAERLARGQCGTRIEPGAAPLVLREEA